MFRIVVLVSVTFPGEIRKFHREGRNKRPPWYMGTLWGLGFNNSERPRQNGRHCADDIFIYMFREWQLLYFDSNFIAMCSNGPMCSNTLLVLVLIMVWHQIGDKQLSERIVTWFTDAHMHDLVFRYCLHPMRIWTSAWKIVIPLMSVLRKRNVLYQSYYESS